MVSSGVTRPRCNRPASLGELGRDDAIDVTGDGHQRHDRLAAGRIRRRSRKELEVVDRGSGSLRDPGDGGRLHDVAAGLGDLDQPVREYPAPLPSEGGDRQLDRSLGHDARRRLQRQAQPPALAAPLQPADERRAHPVEEAIPRPGVVDELGAVERRTQHRSIRHFAAHPAADAAVVDVRDRDRCAADRDCPSP